MKIKINQILRVLVCCIFIIPCSCSGTENSGNQNVPPDPVEKIPQKVILDTDMCLDVDDVGALATLNALADQDEAEILAVCFNEVHKSGAAAIDAINTWYHRGNIPVGIYKKSLYAPDSSPYLNALAGFPNDIPSDLAQVPDAHQVYIDVLNAQPDSSVKIISLGFLNNLGDLLESHPELIARKVKQLVIMGGLNNDDFNLVRHGLVETSQKILTNWPTPIVISQPGSGILTGETLESSPVNNPVREAYFRWFNNSFQGRPSWDQIAVLFTLKGTAYFNEISVGTGSLKNGFSYDLVPGWRTYFTTKLSDQEYAYIINNLMTKTPKSK